MPPRTKACALCRKKRIKCDATLPECLMCIRTGKRCPGPLDGPLIIDMTSGAASRPKKKRIKGPSHVSGIQPPKFPDQIMNRMSLQIDQGAVINEAFYAHFLAYFTSEGEGRDIQNRFTWLHRLPDLSSDGTNNALTLAVRATATAYCGAETGNMSVLQNAWNFYGQALQAHAHLLKSNRKEYTVHMVSTSVMLSLFEAMQATTANAYREHINGAVKMIEQTGPGQCYQGVLCQLFFHIRTQMAFVYLTTRSSQAVPVKKILVENLQYRRLPIFQQLMTHIATLAEIYVDMPSVKGEQMIDIAVYDRVKGDVEALWLTYKEEAASREETLYTVEDGETFYRDGFTALCVSYFSAARVLFAVLAPRLACTYVDFTDHFATILNCAKFLRTKKIGCAYMRMATPLYLVSLHSPCPDQRRQATDIFEEWKHGSMAGISTLALEKIYTHQDKPITANEFDYSPESDESQLLAMSSSPCIPLDLGVVRDWVEQV